jgi:Reverse transcriptase (RNA-dependent DNA polymerase)
MQIKLLMQLTQCQSRPLYMLFFDIKKAYDTLDRTQTINLLRQYGVGNNTCRMIQGICNNEPMVPQQQKYYGQPFQAERGVRQGGKISPTIFNIVVDAVIRECEGQLPSQDHTILQFYADDGLIAAHDPIYAQSVLDLFVHNFQRFGLRINHQKTETMTLLGTKPVHNISHQAYSRMITRTGTTNNKKIQKQVTACNYCNTNVQQSSMKRHQQSQSCMQIQKQMPKNQPALCLPFTVEEELEPQTHIISIRQQQQTACPHPNCPYITHKGDIVRKHFRNCHPEDSVIIEQEGLLPHCPNCGIFQSNAHTPQHKASLECKKGITTKKKKLQETLQTAATHVKFFLGQEQIQKKPQFKYLGRIITEQDIDLAAAENQLESAQRSWLKINKVVKRCTNNNPWVMSLVYKTIILSTLLYGAENWFTNTTIMNKLNSFHNSCARTISRRHIRLLENGTWEYPNNQETL